MLAWSVPAHADDHPVGQAKKAFTVPCQGESRRHGHFRNDDEFAHNVFSLSDVQSFDLGSYKKGEVRSLKLSDPGVIEVECAIHPGNEDEDRGQVMKLPASAGCPRADLRGCVHAGGEAAAPLPRETSDAAVIRGSIVFKHLLRAVPWHHRQG